MANITVTLTDTAGFTPQAWANTALSVLRNAIVATKVIARDSDFTDPGWKGKQITVPYPGTFTAQAKTANNVATLQTPSGGNSVPLALGSPQTVDFILEDVAFSEAQNGMSLMKSYGEAAGVALAEKVEADILALISAGSFTGAPSGNAASSAANMPGKVGGPLVYADIIAARKALSDKKAPSTDRYLLMGTKAWAEALVDTSLLGYFQFAQNAAFTDANPGKLGGMIPAESQLMPSIDGTAVAHSLQTLTAGGTWTGGTFTITYSGQTTAAIAYNATARAVENAIAALSNVGAGKVRVSGGPGGSTAVFQIALFLASPVAFTVSVGSLTGTSPTLAVSDNTGQANLCFAMHKNAAIIAFRPLQTISTPGVEVAYANDPVSGISVRIQMQVKPEYRGLYVGYDILYGLTALRADQGVAILN